METIFISTTVKAPIDKVWQAWNSAEGIKGWAFADDSWAAESISNDLTSGGKFLTKMYAKESGQGFDFSGTYGEVVEGKLITYTLDDGRTVRVEFAEVGDDVEVKQWFEPEQENDLDFQKSGWQAFLDNFKKYVESV